MAEGSFSCENGSDLFYENGTERLSNITYCNSDASWSGQHHLQCWKGLHVNFVIAPTTLCIYEVCLKSNETVCINLLFQIQIVNYNMSPSK